MNCEFVEVSVLQDIGIEALTNRVIDKCLELEEIRSKQAPENQSKAFKIGHASKPSEYVDELSPIELRPSQRKKKKCC